MKVLVLNCGSSSLKYQLVDMEKETVLASGLCERIGIGDAKFKHSPIGKEDFKSSPVMNNHSEAVKVVMDALTDKEHGVIGSIKEISAVGHRVVHGGEFFSKSVVITEAVKEAITKCADLAPLHNPPNLVGIEACEMIMCDIPQVAVFDTAFHQTMPEVAYQYAIPYELYEKYKIRRYGFHGTSHRFVSARAAEMLGKPLEELKLITCHLGNGASICAVKNGKSVDTSMGFTPLEGLVMGTRSGDIDPAVLSYICEKENFTVKETENLLNKKSGVLGLSGVSSDFRDIESAAADGSHRANLALEVFYYRVAKYVGEYAAAMNGVDAVIFTAGLGENSKVARKEVCSYLTYLGLHVDDVKNDCRGKEVDFATDCSTVRALCVPTNEEIVIARDTRDLLSK